MLRVFAFIFSGRLLLHFLRKIIFIERGGNASLCLNPFSVISHWKERPGCTDRKQTVSFSALLDRKQSFQIKSYGNRCISNRNNPCLGKIYLPLQCMWGRGKGGGVRGVRGVRGSLQLCVRFFSLCPSLFLGLKVMVAKMLVRGYYHD